MNTKDIYFDGSLYSMRRLVKMHGIDKFCIATGYDLNRVSKLYSSMISGSAYVDDILSIELGKFEDAFYNLELIDCLNKKTKENNIKKVEVLNKKKKKADKKFCKIGLDKTFNLLSKYENNDIWAKIFKLCLEIENLNILAKTKPFLIKNEAYKKKHKLINDLIILFKIYNFNYGIKEYNLFNNLDINSIIFFDTPAGQISWHTHINDIQPHYENEWDGKECSTLNKLEKFIKLNYK